MSPISIIVTWCCLLGPGAFQQAGAVDELDLAAMIRPLPEHAHLEHETWHTWGASVLEGEDGRFHMFYCRWPKAYPFKDGWVLDAEICYAVADRPAGPFRHVRTILRGRKHDGRVNAFDGGSVYNPHVRAFDGKVYLYYAGNHDPGSDRMIGNRDVAVTHQAIGVVIADSAAELGAGRFARLDRPILAPLSRIRGDIPEEERYGDPERVTPANIVVVNPSVERRPDGRYLLMFKGWAANTAYFAPVHGVALADSPTGPFRVHPEPVLAVPLGDGRLVYAEDPYLWYSEAHERFFSVVKDFHGHLTGAGASIALFESPDGISWKRSRHCLVCRKQLLREDGTVADLKRLERPQLLFDDEGRPIMLYAAAMSGDRSFNVHVPLGVSTEAILRPRPCQVAWQEAELGVLVSYELHTFNRDRYNQRLARKTPVRDVDQFNPVDLDTDQWIRAARDGGARFAILTASHESGFRLWQSDVNPYCLRAVSWGGGKRDIVGEFVSSCRRYGVEPGIYLGTRWNAHLGVHDFRVTDRSPVSQEAYNRLIEGEVEEICTRYGDWFEIWFDGGAHGPLQGGPDVLSIVERHQPEAVFYHNLQRADARWGGSETGTVPYPCWATFPFRSTGSGESAGEHIRRDGFALLKHGDPLGGYWMPAMSDAPLRGHGGHDWFWEPDGERFLYPLAELVDMYCRSVGHNSTLIIGITPDRHGLVPDVDVLRLQEFGASIRRVFGRPLAQTAGEGYRLELPCDGDLAFDHLVLQEDIRQGERVREYRLEVRRDEVWTPLATGTCIGHKRIHRFPPRQAAAVRLTVQRAIAAPRIRHLGIYASGD